MRLCFAKKRVVQKVQPGGALKVVRLFVGAACNEECPLGIQAMRRSVRPGCRSLLRRFHSIPYCMDTNCAIELEADSRASDIAVHIIWRRSRCGVRREAPLCPADGAYVDDWMTLQPAVRSGLCSPSQALLHVLGPRKRSFTHALHSGCAARCWGWSIVWNTFSLQPHKKEAVQAPPLHSHSRNFSSRGPYSSTRWSFPFQSRTRISLFRSSQKALGFIKPCPLGLSGAWKISSLLMTFLPALSYFSAQILPKAQSP